MELKLSQVVLGYRALQNIGTERMPIKLAYTIQRNMRILSQDFRDYENKRVEIIKTKYGEKDGAGNWQVTPAKGDDFAAEMEALGETLVNLDIRVLDINATPIAISPNDMNALEWMFTDVPIKVSEAVKEERKRHG